MQVLLARILRRTDFFLQPLWLASGLVMSAGMVAEFIANISHKSNVTLTAAQSLQVEGVEAITAF